MFFLPSKGFNSELPDRIHVAKGGIDFIMNTSESVANDDYFPFIQAIQSLVPEIDINQMAIPDFYALVVYARVQLFPASPVTYKYSCRNTVFDTSQGRLTADAVQAKVRNKELDPKEQLKPSRCKCANSLRILDYAQFDCINFDPEGFDTERFDLPRVHLLTEWKRLIREPKFRYVVPAIGWLKDGDSLEDKLKIVENDLELFDELSKLNVDKSFGLRSEVHSECTACGKKQALPLHIDNQSFLRM